MSESLIALAMALIELANRLLDYLIAKYKTVLNIFRRPSKR